MKTCLKSLLVLLICLTSCNIFAQKVLTPKELNLQATDTTLSASFQNKSIPVSNAIELETFLKNNQDSSSKINAVIESKGMISAKRYRELVKILNKYNIHDIRAVAKEPS